MHELNLNSNKDRLYSNKCKAGSFRFDATVAAVFDDMVSRSVPLYADVIQEIAHIAVARYEPGSKIYDLGCSTGTTIDYIARALGTSRPCSFVGLDGSRDMLERARLKLAPHPHHSFHFDQCQLEDLTIDSASLVIMNYTLQFIPPLHRLRVLERVRAGMKPQGVFILSEKILPAAGAEVYMDAAYARFKKKNGYSQTEIETKKEALDTVLVPYTIEQNMDLLKAAGFSWVQPIMQWNHFVTFLAVADLAGADLAGADLKESNESSTS